VQVSPRAGVPRSGFVYRRGFNAATPGLLSLVRGDQFLALGRFDQALAEYEASVAAGHPDLPVARWKLAHGYLRSNRVVEAVALLEPLRETHPDVVEVATGLGFARYFQGRFEDAAAHLEHAVGLRPPEAPVLNILGDSLARLGRTEEARAAMERSLAIQPDQPEVAERLKELGEGL